MVAQISVFQELISMLSRASSPQEVLALKASAEEEQRMDVLIKKKHTGRLTGDETLELHEYLLAEELIGLAKAYAFKKIHAA